MAGKWGQEARFDRWVKYRLQWAVHYAPPPKKTGAGGPGLTARSSPPNLDREEGGREGGGGGAAFAATGIGRGGEIKLN